MATVNVSFTWDTTTLYNAWTASPGTSVTLSNGTGGDGGTTCLSAARAVKGNSGANSTWTLATTWTALGVPSGATVTGVTAGSIKSKCTVFTSAGSGNTAGAATLVDGGTTITLSSQRSITATDAAFVTTNGVDATGLALAAADSITLTVNVHNQNSNTTGSSVTILQDTLAFTITYRYDGSVSETGSAADTVGATAVLSASVAETGSAADTVNAGTSIPASVAETGSAADSPDATVTSGAAPDNVIRAPLAILDGRELVTNSFHITAPTDPSSNTYNDAVTEAGSAADTVSDTAALVGSAAESGASADIVGASAIFGSSLSETGNASDGTSTVVGFGAAVTEAASAAEANSAAAIFPASDNETASAVDTPDGAIGAQTFNESIAEAASANDLNDATLVPGTTDQGGAGRRTAGYSWRDFSDTAWFNAFREQVLRAHRLKNRKRRKEEIVALERAIKQKIAQEEGRRAELAAEIERAGEVLTAAAETVSDQLAQHIADYFAALAAEIDDEDAFLLLN
jgi:hypothetical protein